MNWKNLILIILLVVLLIVGYYAYSEDKPLTGQSERFVAINECYLYQPRIPFHPETQVLGSLIENPIIDLLIQCESGGNPNAIGKAGERGILQFMPQTFKHFCVEKYGLENDIWNPDIQIECCKKMLEQGLEQHWTCFNMVGRK